MSSPVLEAFLARLYTDAELRARFVADPERVAEECDVEPALVQGFDVTGLLMFVRSLARKRGGG